MPESDDKKLTYRFWVGMAIAAIAIAFLVIADVRHRNMFDRLAGELETISNAAEEVNGVVDTEVVHYSTQDVVRAISVKADDAKVRGRFLTDIAETLELEGVNHVPDQIAMGGKTAVEKRDELASQLVIAKTTYRELVLALGYTSEQLDEDEAGPSHAQIVERAEAAKTALFAAHPELAPKLEEVPTATDLGAEEKDDATPREGEAAAAPTEAAASDSGAPGAPPEAAANAAALAPDPKMVAECVEGMKPSDANRARVQGICERVVLKQMLAAATPAQQ